MRRRPTRSAWKRRRLVAQSHKAGSNRPWLPELEAVALGIGRPAEAAELMVLDPLVDLDTRGPKLGEHRVEVGDGEVDHRLLLTRPVVRVLGERDPVRVPALREDDVALLDGNTQVLGVPQDESVRISRPEEDAADPRRALPLCHGTRLPPTMAGGMGGLEPVAPRPRFPRDYGIPDAEEGLLPWSWASERLESTRNYW